MPSPLPVRLRLCLTLGLTAAGLTSAHAATLTVPAQYPTIGAAVTAAASGDTVLVADGTYYENSLTTHGKAMTIQSANGPAHCVIDGQQQGRVFVIQEGETSSTVLQGFTIRGGSGEYGGGVSIYSCSPSVVDCVLTGNATTNGGGGVYVQGGSPAFNGCTFSGNSASRGGGVFLEGSLKPGTPALTNCTFTANSSGGLLLNGGSPLITNCILYEDAGSEIVSGTSAAPTITYCDVQGGYAGTGDINADPLFVSAADLHLKPGSPCLGAGTSAGAPATDQDGNARPNPPSIGALEVTPGTTHILWDNSSGLTSVWDYSTADGTFSHQEYGPYAGYTAQAIADGPDGRTRILWDRSDGLVSVWSLDNAAGAFTYHEFGPYSGYTAIGVSVGQ